MFTDSDVDITELDIESKSFNKMKEKMKILGFQEGVAKGRDNLLQEGFDLGYVDGFKFGFNLGITKGKIMLKTLFTDSEKNHFEECEKSSDVKNNSCRICQHEKSSDKLDKSNNGLEQLKFDQQKYNSKIIKNLQNSNLVDGT